MQSFCTFSLLLLPIFVWAKVLQHRAEAPEVLFVSCLALEISPSTHFQTIRARKMFFNNYTYADVLKSLKEHWTPVLLQLWDYWGKFLNAQSSVSIGVNLNRMGKADNYSATGPHTRKRKHVCIMLDCLVNINNVLGKLGGYAQSVQLETLYSDWAKGKISFPLFACMLSPHHVEQICSLYERPPSSKH